MGHAYNAVRCQQRYCGTQKKEKTESICPAWPSGLQSVGPLIAGCSMGIRKPPAACTCNCQWHASMACRPRRSCCTWAFT